MHLPFARYSTPFVRRTEPYFLSKQSFAANTVAMNFAKILFVISLWASHMVPALGADTTSHSIMGVEETCPAVHPLVPIM